MSTYIEKLLEEVSRDLKDIKYFIQESMQELGEDENSQEEGIVVKKRE